MNRHETSVAFTLTVTRKQLVLFLLLLSSAGFWSFMRPESSSKTAGDAGPLPVVQLTEMQALYRGYDNQLYGKVFGFEGTKLEGTGVVLEKQEGEWEDMYTVKVVDPKAKEAQIGISGVTGKTPYVMGQFHYRILNIPDGICALGKALNGDKIDLLETQISVTADNLPISPVYSISGWKLFCENGTFWGKDDKLSPEATTALQTSKKGSTVSLLITYTSSDEREHTGSLVLFR